MKGFNDKLTRFVLHRNGSGLQETCLGVIPAVTTEHETDEDALTPRLIRSSILDNNSSNRLVFVRCGGFRSSPVNSWSRRRRHSRKFQKIGNSEKALDIIISVFEFVIAYSQYSI